MQRKEVNAVELSVNWYPLLCDGTWGAIYRKDAPAHTPADIYEAGETIGLAVCHAWLAWKEAQST